MGCGSSAEDSTPPRINHQSTIERLTEKVTTLEKRMEHSLQKSVDSFDADESLEIFNTSVQFFNVGDVSPPRVDNEEDWDIASVLICKGIVKIRKHVPIAEMDLKGTPLIKLDHENKWYIVSIEKPETVIRVRSMSQEEAHSWITAVREQLLLLRTTGETEGHQNGTHFQSFLKFFGGSFYEEGREKDDDMPSHQLLLPSSGVKTTHIAAPKMNIVILVVGTRGDVQPFVYFGQALQRDGHRVRLATHAEYRDDVVSKGGLEFYPLAGDPKKLSEYMVKTAGRLVPDLLNSEERRALPEKMQMLKDITFSTFPACTAADPGDPDNKPFLADAIVSNPVSYGHIHCAEALSVPLHIMFPQPWSPTKEFPHPLSNLGFSSSWSTKNYLSYKMIDELMWLGLGSMINSFRKHTLGLHALRIGEHADQLLNDNKVPISHMWSPSFVPKCKDWPIHVDVVGEYRPAADGKTAAFSPASALAEFLAAGDKPLYIGFGSMVIEDASLLVDLIKKAASKINCRILLQSGWTKYGEDNSLLSPEVMVIGAMPHDWLFSQVSGVVHHGGAGTTSAGLRAGNPTFICPFFGDQHFWAEMVHRAGAGPKGCRIQDLTEEKLIASLSTLRDHSVQQNALKLSEKMLAEDGVAMGVQSFYRNLPLANMICEVTVFNDKQSNIAEVYCTTCGMKMCTAADEVIHRNGSGRESHIRAPFRPARYGVVDPKSALKGFSDGLGIAVYEVAGGVWDLVSKPVKRGKKEGVKGVALGAADGVYSLFARPLKGGKVMVERIATGAAKSSQNPTSIDSSLHVQRAGDYRPPPDMESLSPADIEIESAYALGYNLMEWWSLVDKDNNRCMDINELKNSLSNRDYNDVKELFERIDTDEDGLITFSEMAWVLSGTVYLDLILSTRVSMRSIPTIRSTLTSGSSNAEAA